MQSEYGAVWQGGLSSSPAGLPAIRFYVLFSVLRNIRDTCKALCEGFIGRDNIAHFTIVVLLVCDQIEVAGTCETKYDGLFLTAFLAFHCLINRGFDRMAALRRRKNPFDSRLPSKY